MPNKILIGCVCCLLPPFFSVGILCHRRVYPGKCLAHQAASWLDQEVSLDLHRNTRGVGRGGGGGGEVLWVPKHPLKNFDHGSGLACIV